MRDSSHHSHADETPDVSHIKNVDVSHEHTDVRIKPILRFGVGLFISAVVVHVLMWVMFEYLEKREAGSEPHSSPFAAERETLPPEPRLQLSPSKEQQPAPDLNEHPLVEMKRMREEQQAALTGYGWVDQQTGVVRVPIEEAKKRLLEKGLPSRPQGQAGATGAQPQAQGTGAQDYGLLPSDSSSGQKLERRYP